MSGCSLATLCGDSGSQEAYAETLCPDQMDGEDPGGHSRQNSEARKTWSEKKATLKSHWKVLALVEPSYLGYRKGG